MAQEDEMIDPTPLFLTEWPDSVYEIQVALHDRILGYKGGIKGVWRVIDEKYKSEGGGKPGITEGAFTRAVSRLMQKSPQNEDMAFAIRGNIILFMHVLEILGIKEFSQLIEAGPEQPKMEAVIYDTNIRVEEIQIKLDEIMEAVDMSNQRTSRFPSIRVCRDWEAVLIYINDLKNFMGNQSILSGLNNWLLGGYDKNIQLAYYFFNILNPHREYFAKDKLLHNFYKKLNDLPLADNTSLSLIILPLYILYFTLTVHRKFITTIFNTLTYDFFINISTDDKGQIIENEKVNAITEGDYGKYILKQNNEIMRYTKKILTLLIEKKNMTINVNFSGYFMETTNILYEIYSRHADYSPESMRVLLDSVKSIDDLYSKMTLGAPHFYYITKEKIDKLDNIKERLEQQLDQIERMDL
jgi:hypothetical protein